MALTIREDESEAGGYAFIDLGRPIAVETVRLAFRRQDSEPRFLGLDGWQPEAAWLPADLVPGRGPNAVVRVGPTVGCAGAYRRHRMGAEPRVSTPSQPREGVVVALVFPCLGRIRVGVDGAP